MYSLQGHTRHTTPAQSISLPEFLLPTNRPVQDVQGIFARSGGNAAFRTKLGVMLKLISYTSVQYWANYECTIFSAEQSIII